MAVSMASLCQPHKLFNNEKCHNAAQHPQAHHHVLGVVMLMAMGVANRQGIFIAMVMVIIITMVTTVILV